jgi:hypothetical protein
MLCTCAPCICLFPLRLRQFQPYFCSLKTNCVDTLDPPHALLLTIKEVIQPQVPLRLPCYDFTPVMNHTVVNVPLAVRLSTSGATHSHGVTGGVYKARERIHRDMLIRDY